VSEPPYPYGPGPQGPYPGQEPGAPYPGQYQGQQPGQYPPQYQGPYQYPQGPYSPYGGVHEHPQGTTILVLGIVALVGGFVCWLPILLGPVAWIMGNSAIAEIDRNPMAYSNRGAVQGGRICGIIATVLLALGLFVILIAVAAA
jgi:hypothetical protein